VKGEHLTSTMRPGCEPASRGFEGGISEWYDDDRHVNTVGLELAHDFLLDIKAHGPGRDDQLCRTSTMWPGKPHAACGEVGERLTTTTRCEHGVEGERLTSVMWPGEPAPRGFEGEFCEWYDDRHIGILGLEQAHDVLLDTAPNADAAPRLLDAQLADEHNALLAELERRRASALQSPAPHAHYESHNQSYLAQQQLCLGTVCSEPEAGIESGTSSSSMSTLHDFLASSCAEQEQLCLETFSCKPAATPAAEPSCLPVSKSHDSVEPPAGRKKPCARAPPKAPSQTTYKLPIAGIRRHVKEEEGVALVAAETPVILSQLCEVFIKDMCAAASEHTTSREIEPLDFVRAFIHHDRFRFLCEA
jgi:hypothetical protein